MTAEKPKPVYDCMDCGERIEQDGEPIPGADGVLGYYRYCEKCRNEGDMIPEQQLADEIVALGIGKVHQIYPDNLGRFYQVDLSADWQTSVNATKFTSDWRVAGAMMDCILTQQGDDLDVFEVAIWQTATRKFMARVCSGPPGSAPFCAIHDSPPRAINEACAAALRDSDAPAVVADKGR